MAAYLIAVALCAGSDYNAVQEFLAGTAFDRGAPIFSGNQGQKTGGGKDSAGEKNDASDGSGCCLHDCDPIPAGIIPADFESVPFPVTEYHCL